MYRPLTLYYLNHLGIRPWMLKKNSVSTHIEVTEAESLVLITQENLSAKAGLLLEQIKNYLQKNYSLIICNVKKESLSDKIPEILAAYQPLKIILLGLSLEPDLKQSLPSIQQMEDLEVLLAQPSLKKLFWQRLSS